MQAIIFDLDGVLVDSWKLARQAFRHAYETCVGPADNAPLQAFRAHAGSPLNEILAALQLPAQMQPLFEQHSRENLAGVRVCDGVIQMLRQLQLAGHPMAVLTGKDSIRTREVLEYTGLKPFFDVVATPQHAPGKPDPGGPLYCCRMLGVAAAGTVLVGDSRLDMAAARNAGMPAVFADWAGGPPLPAHAYDVRVKSPRELATLLSSGES